MSNNLGGEIRPVAGLLRHGRLTTIPRRETRRAQLLDHLRQTLFESDRSYSEQEVNQVLLGVHEDYSTLRRSLVEAGLLTRTRDGGSYRRVG
ncbi:DUF2087 domain-containing protein [Streptomyces sp. NPDC006879]|uniref:DUF2087 domain-containing protein n=1 Tax=Streptomyces sp. NPDC006879 TaxID=3364767 RepID=UPI0036C7E06C